MLPAVSSVGLVLGGGGITGASYHFGALLALEMATGWHPDQADVIVGTSCGAFAAAMTRGGGLTIDTFLGDAETRDEVAERLRNLIFRRTRPKGMLRWLRRGVLPGLARPDLKLVLGSPALYETSGVAEWVDHTAPALAGTWPDKPTVIVAYDLVARSRTPFGTEAAPDVALKDAVAASVAVPFVLPVDTTCPATLVSADSSTEASLSHPSQQRYPERAPGSTRTCSTGRAGRRSMPNSTSFVRSGPRPTSSCCGRTIASRRRWRRIPCRSGPRSRLSCERCVHSRHSFRSTTRGSSWNGISGTTRPGTDAGGLSRLLRVAARGAGRQGLPQPERDRRRPVIPRRVRSRSVRAHQCRCRGALRRALRRRALLPPCL